MSSFRVVVSRLRMMVGRFNRMMVGRFNSIMVSRFNRLMVGRRPHSSCRLSMVRASSCLRVHNFLWQRGGVAHTVAVAEVPVVPFCLHEDILKSVLCKKGQDHPRSAEAKLRAARSKGGTAMDPLHLVSPGNNQSWLKFDLEEFT